jgi:hypothetical protein
MPQEFRVLEVQGRREWRGKHGENVDWEIKVENSDGTQMEVVTTRKPTSQAPIYGDVILGDIHPPKFEDSRPVLRKQFVQQASGGGQWQQEGTSTNGAPTTVTSGGFNPAPPRQNGGGTDPNWTPDRAQRYDAKQNAIIRQHSQTVAVSLAQATGSLNGADLSNPAIRDEVFKQLAPVIDWFDQDAKADNLIQEAKQAFPGSTEVSQTQVPSDDIPVGL